ncbi:MAG: hypothetical protein HPY60_11455 [Candidatus Methanofastidiosum sp.]|nr:hypothetical protein [Methanofastidiosum sp.]
MTSQINERIEIAKSFKSIYNWTGKNPEKKEKLFKRVAFLDYGIVMFLLSVLIIASAMSTLQIEYFSGNWTNAGILVLMTMALSLRAPFSYIELMLHNHINQIKNLEIEFDPNLNTEFNSIVKRFNKRGKYIYLFGIPVILIFISALLQVFDANPYWEKFPPIVLLVCLYLIIQINYDIAIMRKNLGKVVNSN